MLDRAGRALVRRIHGERRSRDGYLLTRHYWLDDDQESLAGKMYLGLLLLLPFVANMEYMLSRYGHVQNGRRVFSFTLSGLPAEEKVLLPLSVLCFLAGFACAFRGAMLANEIATQTREDLGE